MRGIKQRFEELKISMRPTIDELKFSLRRLRKSPLSIAGIVIILIFAFIAIFAPVLAPPIDPRDPYTIWRDGFYPDPRPPGSPVIDSYIVERGWSVHYFGTTGGEIGQLDIYYGCIWGARTAFRVGLLVVVIALVIGLLTGCLAGYYGGIIDEVLMRFTDIILAFPGLVLSMALVIALPMTWYVDVGAPLSVIGLFIVLFFAGGLLKRSGAIKFLMGMAGVAIFLFLYFYFGFTVYNIRLDLNQLDKVLIALAIVGWPGYTRLIRGEILRVKQEDYVEAARAVGCSDLRIIVRHILPNAMYSVLIVASLDIGAIVLTAAALSFLGIGAPLGYADWGQMISFARNTMVSSLENPLQYWYTFTIPGIFIFMFVLGWNLLGDAFRDILDPTLRRR